MSCRGEQAQQNALLGVGGNGPGSEFEAEVDPEGYKRWIPLDHFWAHSRSLRKRASVSAMCLICEILKTNLGLYKEED